MGDGFITFDNADGVRSGQSVGAFETSVFYRRAAAPCGSADRWRNACAPDRAGTGIINHRFFKSTGIAGGQSSTRLANLGNGGTLPMRCAWLQLWASALTLPGLRPPRFRAKAKSSRTFSPVGQPNVRCRTGGVLCSRIKRNAWVAANGSSSGFSSRGIWVPLFACCKLNLGLQRAHQLIADSKCEDLPASRWTAATSILGFLTSCLKKRFWHAPE